MSNSTADQMMAQYLAIPNGPVALAMIKKGLEMEIRFPGMRLTGKAPKCSTILRQRFGLSGKPPKLLAQFEALLAQYNVA